MQDLQRFPVILDHSVIEYDRQALVAADSAKINWQPSVSRNPPESQHRLTGFGKTVNHIVPVENSRHAFRRVGLENEAKPITFDNHRSAPSPYPHQARVPGSFTDFAGLADVGKKLPFSRMAPDGLTGKPAREIGASSGFRDRCQSLLVGLRNIRGQDVRILQVIHADIMIDRRVNTLHRS